MSDFAKQILAAELEPEKHTLPGTSFSLHINPLTTRAYEKILEVCRIPAKGKKKTEGFNSGKARHMVYSRCVRDWSGLTSRMLRETLKIQIEINADADKELSFSQEGVDLINALADVSPKFNKFLWDKCVVTDDMEDEAEDFEDEKKT